MNAWTWTVMQLMTDTAVLAELLAEQRKVAEIREIMQRLDAKLEAIVNA